MGATRQDVKAEPQANGIKQEHKEEEEEEEGRIWHVQAHARNAITAMKVDPVDGSGVSLREAMPCSKLRNEGTLHADLSPDVARVVFVRLFAPPNRLSISQIYRALLLSG